MKKIALLLLFLVAFCVSKAPAQTPLTGRDVARLVDEVDTSRDSRKTMLMVIERGDQRLMRKMESFTKKFPPDERSLIRFEAPSDIRDTSYLTWSWDSPEREDDMWVFLPTANIVRRISGGGKKGSFMRSDLANEDIEKRAVADDTQTILRNEAVKDHDCWVVEYVPVDTSETGYSKRIAWIRKDINLPVRIDYYDKRGELCKTAHHGGFKQIEGIWTSTRALITSPHKHSRTMLQLKDIKYNTGLASTFFDQSNLIR